MTGSTRHTLEFEDRSSFDIYTKAVMSVAYALDEKANPDEWFEPDPRVRADMQRFASTDFAAKIDLDVLHGEFRENIFGAVPNIFLPPTTWNEDGEGSYAIMEEFNSGNPQIEIEIQITNPYALLIDSILLHVLPYSGGKWREMVINPDRAPASEECHEAYMKGEFERARDLADKLPPIWNDTRPPLHFPCGVKTAS